MPFDFLGRSLSYNPYLPRGAISDFKREGKIAKKCFCFDAFSYDNLAFIAKCDTEVVRVDFASMYEENILQADAFDCITQLRRYSKKFIIHNDIFLTQYQVLESCIYGSDGIILDAGILGRELGGLCEFATRLSLVPIVRVGTLGEVKAAIFAKAQVLYIAQDFANLISCVPNSKVILRDMDFDAKQLDEKNSYGVDMFFVSVSL